MAARSGAGIDRLCPVRFFEAWMTSRAFLRWRHFFSAVSVWVMKIPWNARTGLPPRTSSKKSPTSPESIWHSRIAARRRALSLEAPLPGRHPSGWPARQKRRTSPGNPAPWRPGRHDEPLDRNRFSPALRTAHAGRGAVIWARRDSSTLVMRPLACSSLRMPAVDGIELWWGQEGAFRKAEGYNVGGGVRAIIFLKSRFLRPYAPDLYRSWRGPP